MYKAIDIEDDLLCELRALPPGEDDELLSYKVGQAVQFYLRHRAAAEQERLDHLHSLDGALAGAEGEDLAASVAAMRNRDARRRSLTEDERLDLIERLGGSLAGPKGEAFAERVAAVRTQPWR